MNMCKNLNEEQKAYIEKAISELKEKIREVATELETTLGSIPITEQDTKEAISEIEKYTSLKELEMYARINKIERKLTSEILAEHQTEFKYLTFVLGYDLLQTNLKGMECDRAFDLCEELIEDFLDSEEYQNMKIPAYDALSAWIENHSKKIDELIKNKRKEVI